MSPLLARAARLAAHLARLHVRRARLRIVTRHECHAPVELDSAPAPARAPESPVRVAQTPARPDTRGDAARRVAPVRRALCEVSDPYAWPAAARHGLTWRAPHGWAPGQAPWETAARAAAACGMRLEGWTP